MKSIERIENGSAACLSPGSARLSHGLAGDWQCSRPSSRKFSQAPKRGNWDDQFDAQASQKKTKVGSTLPIFSQQTASNIEAEMFEYQNIVAQGGWPQVPAAKKLKLGVNDACRSSSAPAADGVRRSGGERGPRQFI